MKVNSKIILLAILAAISFFVAGFSLGKSIMNESAFPIMDYLFTPFITLFAAFGGSWYAFRLQAEKTKQDVDEKNVKAANNVIFELTRWYNKLHAFQKQFISEHLNNPLRHLLIMPVAELSFGSPKFDYDSLAFIFKSKNPNLLGTLSLAEAEISSTLDVIQQRSKMHVEVLQPAVEEIEKRLCVDVFSLDDIEKQLGARNAQTIRMLTDYIISGVDNSIKSIRKHIDLIKEVTESIYPGHVIIGMIDPPSVLKKSPKEGA